MLSPTQLLEDGGGELAPEMFFGFCLLLLVALLLGF